jgi:hypothetical protein
MTSRRQFIATGIAALAGLAGWRFFAGSDENAIIAVLRKRLHYLTLDEAGLRAYAKDLAAQKIVASNRLRMLDVAGPLYTRFALPDYKNALLHELRHGEERVVSIYLLSSDFFLNGANESRVVHYLHYYDPIHRPRACTNPFARPLAT